MAWVTPINWLGKAVGYDVTRADMQTISDSLAEVGTATGCNGVSPGWMNAPHPWVYVGATSFKIVGFDDRIFYPVGAKLYCTDAGDNFGYVLAPPTYAGGNTTVGFYGGTDYTLSGGAITAPHVSYVATPAGFPAGVAFTPVESSGWTGATTMLGWLIVNGHEAIVHYTASGTSDVNTCVLELPITAIRSAWAHPSDATNNGAYTGLVGCAITAGATTLVFTLNGSTTGWTTSAGKSVSGQIVIPI